MVRWRRWIRPGLIVSFGLAMAAILLSSGDIEQQLAERTRAQLDSDGHGWAQVEVSGRSVTVGGTSPSREAQVAAIQSAGRVSGVATVTDASDLLPLAAPYIWSVRKSGRVLTLVGTVPSEGFRTSLLAAARRAMPDAEIHDEMQLARGAPPAYNAGTAFVLDRLAYLDDATVTITDSTLSVVGVAVDPAAFEGARQVFSEGVPAQLALGPIDILPARADPFVWSANYDGSSVSLAGFVPDEGVREMLRETAASAFADAVIVDDMRLASGAPDGFADAAAFAIGALTRFERGGVALDGMLLDVTGKARTVDAYESVLAAFAGALPPGMRIVASVIEPATVSAYGWRGEKDGSEVTLSGFVPSPGAKREVFVMASELFAENRLVDNVRVAVGEPRMDWIGAVKFALRQLDRLKDGSVELGDRIFSIEGEAESPEAYTALLMANTQTLPASLELRSADVEPPATSPFVFVAAREPDAIRLDGYVESPEERQEIVTAVRETFGSERLVDNLVFASGAPERFVDAAKVAVHAVSRLAGGRSEISDATVSVSGGAYYPAAAGALADTVGETMPIGFNVALSIIVRQPGQPVSPLRCRDLLQDALSGDRIEFDGGNREVSPDSFGALDRVAATLERCPEATIEIAAHTDSDGSTAHNQELSEARATAILEYLVDAGVRRERLSAVGHGEDDPIADNSTEEGKASNRRIEFLLAVPEGEDNE